MPLTKITGEEFDNTQGGLSVAGIISASSNLLVSGNLSVGPSGSYMNVTSSGVGIGTLTPQERVHIFNSASSNYIRLDNPSGTAYYGLNSSGDTEIIAATNNNLIFKTFGTERARIDSSARLGIGTNNPQRQLHIYGNNCELLIEDPLNSINSNRLNIFLSADKAQFRMLNQTGTGGTIFLQGDAIGNITLPTANTSILNSSGRKILNQTGGVLQVLNLIKTDQFTTTSGTPVDITGFNLSITPSSTSSKILIIAWANISTSGGGGDGYVRLMRDATPIANGNGSMFGQSAGQDYFGVHAKPITYLDSPATTSSVNYKIQAWGANTSYVNGRGLDGGFVTSSGITLMEISG